MRKNSKRSWKQTDLSFVAGFTPLPSKPVTVVFDSVAWVKELLNRPAGERTAK